MELSNWTLKALIVPYPKKKKRVLWRKVQFKNSICEERSNSRIQFVWNFLKLVLQILDLGPSSKVALRIEGSDWKVSRKWGNY
jgi:hypothetical protein